MNKKLVYYVNRRKKLLIDYNKNKRLLNYYKKLVKEDKDKLIALDNYLVAET